MKTTRREFLSTATTAALGAGILIGAAACSDSETEDGTGTGGGSAPMGGCTDSTISANHGHELTIPQADVDAGTEKTYSIIGSSPHDHMITVSATDFMALAGGGSVTITSTNDSMHDHEVTVTCG